MIHEDFYTGEPVNIGSPQNFINSSQDMEAANMASFGKYDYDPGNRQLPQASIYPGGNGFNSVVNPIQPLYPPTQQGIGAMPPGYTPYTPYGNVGPTYGQFRTGMQQQQVQYQQPTTYHIPGVNLSGDFIPPADFDKYISGLEREFWIKQQELEVEKEMERNNSVYGYGGWQGYNYYGTPYYNPYQYNAINNEYSAKLEELKNKAKDTRLEFDINLSKLAHNFVNDGISEEAIVERYQGKSIDIPRAMIPSYQEYYEQNRLYNLVPFDNSQEYRDHMNMVRNQIRNVIPENADLKETSEKMAIIWSDWELEEEEHRRKNAGVLYNSGDNSYKYFVRRKAQERYMREHGVQPTTASFNYGNGLVQSYVDSSPLLSQTATLADDGTLNVSLDLPCNVGSHKGQTYSIHNSQESEYDEKRERFNAFLDSIPGNIYLDNQKNKKIEGYNYE